MSEARDQISDTLQNCRFRSNPQLTGYYPDSIGTHFEPAGLRIFILRYGAAGGVGVKRTVPASPEREKVNLLREVSDEG